MSERTPLLQEDIRNFPVSSQVGDDSSRLKEPATAELAWILTALWSAGD